MFFLKDKVALVTGASRGIGRAIALLLAERGARVVANYFDGKDKAKTVVNEIIGNGGEAIAFQADVSKRADCEQLVEKTVEKFGRIDILVNNAGVHEEQPIDEVSEENWERLMNVNAKSVYMMSVYAGRAMRRYGKGAIVNIGSVAKEYPRPLNFIYAASKGAVSGLTRAFAISFAPEIRVNAVAPARIKTEMSPTKDAEHAKRIAESNLRNRDGEPEDIANIVAFLASDEADWLTGETILADGGCMLKMASLRGRVESSVW